MLKKIISIGFINILLLAFVISVAAPTQSASAAAAGDFKAGNIINDGVFFNPSAMSAFQIQAFLNAKVPTCDTNGSQIYSGSTTRAQYGASKGYPAPYTCLKDYSVSTPNRAAEAGLCGAYGGGVKTSAQIIYDVAQTCGVNPQVLLVLLQKEEGLVTDDWPWPSQYQIATGFGCPDSAACDTTYYGFFNQVYNAARIYRRYIRDAAEYNYVAGRNNNIYYQADNRDTPQNEQTICGYSSLYLLNQATAGLYNYTPYQPNGAALANLYGTGDGCSAYGNRNFWRMFYDWFGSTTGGVSLIKSATNPTVYVLYGGQRQGIPSVDVLNAWGLGSLPVTTTDDASIAVFTDRGVLTRLVKNPLNPAMLLLADNGGFFNAWPSMVQDYGIDPNSASTIGAELLTMTSWSTNLTPFVTTPSGSGVYVVDGGSTHLFSSAHILNMWAGSNPSIVGLSSSLFNQLSAGGGVFSNDVTVGSSRYLVDNARTFSVPASISSSFASPSTMVVSQSFINALPQNGPLSQFVKSPDSSLIYFVDSYSKHGFTSGELLNAFTKNNQPDVTNLSTESLSSIPSSSPISSHFVYNNSTNTSYYLNNSLSNIGADFAATSYALGLSSGTLANYTTQSGSLDCGSSNGFVQASGSPGIFMLEGGTKRPISSLDDLLMLDASQKVCILSAADLAAIPTGSLITPFVSNAGNFYVLDGSNRFSVTNTQLQSLGIQSTTAVSAGTLSKYTDAGSFAFSFKVGDSYHFVDSAADYSTTNQTLATVWSLSTSQSHSQSFVNHIRYGGSISQFARSTDTTNGCLYLVDNGKYLPVTTMAGLINAGYSGQNIPAIAPSVLAANTAATWHGYAAKDASGNTWILDGGSKRSLSAQYRSAWMGSQTETSMSDAFLSLLLTGTSVTNAVKTPSNATIYGLKDGAKYGIPSADAYSKSGLSPAVDISSSLLQSIPGNSVWQNN